MTCEIQQFADCGDIATLGRALFVPEKDDPNWLTQCPMSLSGCGNLLAVCYKNRLCLLTSQWISSTDSNTYLISWSGTLPADITVVRALPICPSKQSSQNGPDWFCIIVGFNNGSVGFYTNTGHQLLLEKLDDKPVMKITCHTGTYGTLPDDVNILFQNSECIITGQSLFKTLRNAKAQLAKVQAGILEEYTVDSRNISIKKWTFTADLDIINDAEMVGLEIKNTYDHLLAASTYGGYDTWYRSIPPVSYLILSAGLRPYVGFHSALEGGTTPPLQDVARAVANKIKSALPGWLGGGSAEKATANTEPLLRSESLYMRNGLYDTQRQGRSVAISQDRRLAAVTDSFGRVAVLDLKRGHLIRLFKGCRDAQCGFIQLFDVENKKPQQCVAKEIDRATFLIIYNPKKGLIDIRMMQRGNRIAVFTATKNGQILYNTCGLVGTEKTYTHKRLNVPEFECVLIDPDGKLKSFIIPFYFALEGEHSQRSKDLYTLRELKEHIKKNSSDLDYLDVIIAKATEIQTVELKKYFIDLLIKKYSIPAKVVMSCLDIFWNSISEDTNAQEIKSYFNNVALITLFYLQINNEVTDDVKEFIAKITPKQDESELNISVDDEPNHVFRLLEDDSCILEKMLNLAQETYYKENQVKVTFAEDNTNDFKEFISCFVLDGKSNYISLKSDTSQEKLVSIACNVFKTIFDMTDHTLLPEFVRGSNLVAKDIVKLIIIHLVNMPLDLINIDLIEKAICVVYYLCQVCKDEVNVYYNEISSWWEDIREMLIEMPCPLRGMIVAMVCKAVGRMYEVNNSEDEAWEALTNESAHWGILIGKLEDISILSIVLLFKANFKGNALPKLTYDGFNINLKYIYSRGKGTITELIAKWLCTMGVSPGAIISNSLMDEYANDEDVSCDSDDDGPYLFFLNNREYVDDNPAIFKWVSLLCRQFPLSTRPDYILANMCWEYAMAWQKDMQKTEELKAVIPCLTNISDIYLKHGMLSIIWSTYLKTVFESSCRLVNKVNRLPKDPLCLQDLGFNNTILRTFLEFIHTFLQAYNIALFHPIDKEKQVIQYEKMWNERTPSLVEVAQDTKITNRDIFNLNYQISYTILIQCHFNIKFSKPLDTLFDIDYQYILDALTGNVPTREISLISSDKIRNPRMKFLTKCVRAAVGTLTLVQVGMEQTYSQREYEPWIQKISTLSRMWNIGLDYVRRQQAVACYHVGCDPIALIEVSNVGEVENILPPILAISIQRLKRSLQQSPNQLEWIASLSPNLYIRVRDTPIDHSIEQTNLNATVQILHRILYMLSNRPASVQDVHDNKLAKLIIENCEVILNKKL